MVRLRLVALATVLLGVTAAYLMGGVAPPPLSAAPATISPPTTPPSPPAVEPTSAAQPNAATSAISVTAHALTDASEQTEPAPVKPLVPTPLWLDAPYVALHLNPRAQIVQGDAPLPPLLDRTTFDALGLDTVISLRRMREDLQRAVGGSHRLRIPIDAEAEVRAPFGLPPLDALAAHARAASTTTRHPNGLHLAPGDTMRGRGILLVEGDLTVETGATLRWDGLVLLHTDRAPHQLRADLLGNVQIRGALAARQVTRDALSWQTAFANAAPSGVHLHLGDDSRLYYDAESLRSALDALLAAPG